MAKAIKSTFNKDGEGWTMQGDVASSGWQASGGHPGGYFGWVDSASGADSYYVAPEKFLGDDHKLYGGTLSYDIEDTGSDAAGIPDVELVGTNGVTLVATVGQPGTTWTHFSIGLDAKSGWHVGSLDGAAATKADFKGVLGDVSQLLIRAEYVNGGETGGLDNVILGKSAPAAHGFAEALATGLIVHHLLDAAPAHLDHGHLPLA